MIFRIGDKVRLVITPTTRELYGNPLYEFKGVCIICKIYTYPTKWPIGVLTDRGVFEYNEQELRLVGERQLLFPFMEEP